MPRYKLRTLLILLAILPPLLAVGWSKYSAWRAEQDRRRAEAATARRFVLAQKQLLQTPLVLTAALSAAMLANTAEQRAEARRAAARAEAGPQILVVPSVRPPELAPNEL